MATAMAIGIAYGDGLALMSCFWMGGLKWQEVEDDVA